MRDGYCDGTLTASLMISRAILVAALCSFAFVSALAQPTASPSADSKLFAMQSNFWVNLHHFLYVTARARRGLDASRPAVTRALGDTAGFGALPTSDRNAWNAALDHYSGAVAERDILFDSSLVATTVALSRLTGNAPPFATAGVDSGIARALERAAPAYRSVWWSRHDAANRQWIAAVRPMLAQYGDSAAAWETRVFGVRWPDEPVPVDVTAYANWAGAYTTARPSHVTMSSLNPDNHGTAAFETLFHEVLHTMDRSLFERFREAARAQGKRLPRGATHPFIFYTAGELTRRLIRGHVPYAEATGLWERSRDLGDMRPLVQRHWQSWIDGQITMDEALRRIVAEL